MALKHSLKPRTAATVVEPLLATAGRNMTVELSSSVTVDHVYLAGGGEGDACLETTVLSEEQVAMFQRSIRPSLRQEETNRQELRQISIVEKTISFTVKVAREDIPSIQGWIRVTYKQSSAQEAWGPFIRDTRATLNLDYIDCIMDIVDKSPVYMINRLIPSATYLVRQTEDSALMDAINEGGVPVNPSWQSVADITLVKQDLLLGQHFQQRIDKKTSHILGLPMTRIEEFSVSKKIIAVTTAREIIVLISDIVVLSNEYYEMKSKSTDGVNGSSNDRGSKKDNDRGSKKDNSPGSTKDADRQSKKGDRQSRKDVNHEDDELPYIDLASLHRLGFESLSRRAVKHPKEVAEICLPFILAAIRHYVDEVDVMVLGFKLLNDIMAFIPLGSDPEGMGGDMVGVLQVIMDCAQYYSPDFPEYYGERKVPYRVLKMQREREKLPPIAEPEGGIQSEKGSKSGSRRSSIVPALAESERSKPEFILDLPVVVPQVAPTPTLTLPAIAPAVKGWKGSIGLKNAGVRKEIVVEVVDPGPKILTKEERFSLLPAVPGIKYQAFSSLLDNKSKTKKRLTLLQIFATLYKFTSYSYANKLLSFELRIPDELCEIAFLCEGAPRVLSYVGWTIDAMYSEMLAFGKIQDLFVEEWEYEDQITVVHLPRHFMDTLSAGLTSTDYLGLLTTSEKRASEKAGTPLSDETKSNINLKNSDKNSGNSPTKKKKIAYSVDVIIGEDKSKRVIVNRELFNLLGHSLFTTRYLLRPSDDVVVAVAIIAGHRDMEGPDQDTAARWLDLWDDRSLHFQYLRKRGLERSGAS